MIFEDVNFNEEAVRKMSLEEFESRHIGLFWLNREESVRKKMLRQAYGLINKPVRASRRKPNG